jgi:hypothetical protein
MASFKSDSISNASYLKTINVEFLKSYLTEVIPHWEMYPLLILYNCKIRLQLRKSKFSAHKSVELSL